MGPIRIDAIVLDFLKTMKSDLKVRAYDERGDQKAETLGRVRTLQILIDQIEAHLYDDSEIEDNEETKGER